MPSQTRNLPRHGGWSRAATVALAVLLILAIGDSSPAVAAGGVVENPQVSTDRSVDCSTAERILEDLVTPGMSDEQRVLQAFHWVRRVLYHGEPAHAYRYDFHRMVNVLGSGSCLIQTAPLAYLLKKLGYESESWVHDTHHMLQVRYGGRWHCLDPHMNFYVWDRSIPPSIAGIEQLRADSTLAWEARREERSGPGFLLCGDSPGWFSGGGDWTREEHWPDLAVEEPFGRITLRRGERYLRTWLPGEHPYRESWTYDPEHGPYHTCGPADREDTVNWPLYEPHLAMIAGRETYRHWGAGTLIYAPDLESDHYQDGAVYRRNLRHEAGRGLIQQQASRPGEVVFAVGCPYVITAGELALATGDSGRVTAWLGRGQQGPWQELALAAEGASHRAAFREPVAGSFTGYYLRLVLEQGASVGKLELTSQFALNPYALPYLVPGKNVVRVEGGGFGSPLELEWRYAEGPDWTIAQSARRSFTAPGEFEIMVGGRQYPRNLALILSVAP